MIRVNFVTINAKQRNPSKNSSSNYGYDYLQIGIPMATCLQICETMERDLQYPCDLGGSTIVAEENLVYINTAIKSADKGSFSIVAETLDDGYNSDCKNTSAWLLNNNSFLTGDVYLRPYVSFEVPRGVPFSQIDGLVYNIKFNLTKIIVKGSASSDIKGPSFSSIAIKY